MVILAKLPLLRLSERRTYSVFVNMLSLTTSPHLRLAVLLSYAAISVMAISTPIARSCPQEGANIYNIITFFATNYLAHAATVPATLDASTYIRVGRSKTFLQWPPVLALFLPCIGLFRSCYLMLHTYYVSCLDDVSVALLSGAMIIVGRTTDWEPPEGREELVYVRLPDKFDQITEVQAAASLAQFDFDALSDKLEEICPADWTTFGSVQLPAGYACYIHHAMGDIEFALDLLYSNLDDTSSIALCRPRSWMKAVLSIVQLVSAVLTLYNTRGDQINRYGYAAYGLSVTPFALMSLVNMVCAGVTGEWPCRYILRTAVLEEAERREGAVFDGVVGTMRELQGDDAEDSTMLSGPCVKPGYEAAFLSMETQAPSDTRPAAKTLVVRKVGQAAKRFPYRPGSQSGAVYRLGIASINDRISPSAPSQMEFFARRYRMWPPAPSFVALGAVFAAFLAFLWASLILPYVVVYALTGFRPQRSTPWERAWLMAWVVASQMSGLLFNLLFITKLARRVFWLLVPVLMVPAVGGYYSVAKMYIEDNGYGSCL